jgi:hypothetical protein
VLNEVSLDISCGSIHKFKHPFKLRYLRFLSSPILDGIDHGCPEYEKIKKLKPRKMAYLFRQTLDSEMT